MGNREGADKELSDNIALIERETPAEYIQRIRRTYEGDSEAQGGTILWDYKDARQINRPDLATKIKNASIKEGLVEASEFATVDLLCKIFERGRAGDN